VAELEDVLWPLCEKVARHARSEEIAGRVVTLKLRATDFRIVTRRRTLPFATQTARTLFAASREMLAVEARGKPWRLIGVGISEIVAADSAVGDLFGEGESRALSGEKAIDTLRGRFGAEAIIMGRSLKR
jgi:DNA polymerase-4